ncbi:MAG: DUF3499 domain-containing protein [Actinobacteria bacterium]|nr:DUF3499 domain-containing protein [Actinomycetota bacterium]
MSSQPSEQSRPHVVRPLSRAVARSCSRPGCPSPAAATLTFAYAERQVVIEDLADEREPSAYDLCIAHADRTSPPHGWELADVRDDVDVDARPLGEQGTVALIAEMLGRTRPDPDVPAAHEQREQGELFGDQDPAADDRASSW